MTRWSRGGEEPMSRDVDQLAVMKGKGKGAQKGGAPKGGPAKGGGTNTLSSGAALDVLATTARPEHVATSLAKECLRRGQQSWQDVAQYEHSSPPPALYVVRRLT